MAAVTSVVGFRGGSLLTASGSTTTTTLVNRATVPTGFAWQVTHTGLNESNASDTGTVVLAFDTDSGLTMTSAAAEAGKYVLAYGAGPLFIPPDVASILYRSLAGAPVLSICRSGNFNGDY
jgi:hypothetical protein